MCQIDFGTTPSTAESGSALRLQRRELSQRYAITQIPIRQRGFEPVLGDITEIMREVVGDGAARQLG